MDNEKKKVNNSVGDDLSSHMKAMDEITDGFYDLSRLYGNPEAPKEQLSREEELRIKEESRRKQEMKAIKADIERRYSLEVEVAQNNADSLGAKTKSRPKSSIMPEIDEHEAVREEIEHIDNMINDYNVVPSAESPSEPAQTDEKPKKKEKPTEEFDISEKNSVYAVIYSFGDRICRLFSTVFGFIFKLISAPFIHLHRAISKSTENAKSLAVKRIKTTLKEILNFRTEIKRAGKTIKRAFKSPLSLPAVVAHYFKKAFSSHNNLLKTTANILMPIASLAILIVTVSYWNDVTFALEVIYNDQSIGYISNESVYIEAIDLVKDRLTSGAYGSGNEIKASVPAASASSLNAKYNLSLVSLDQLNDAQSISDKMIENSVDNLTHACGIYIDGDFICAVKNEADAKTVFYDILAPYEEDAKKNNYVVGFAENIDYVQGLYPDDSNAMWDAAKLSETVLGTKSEAEAYVIEDGDSLESIAEENGVSADIISALNPSYDWEDIQAGDSIIIKNAQKLVSIKKIVSTSTVRDIEFDTVQRRDATKYSGYRQVIQEGVDGSERVTKTQVYIDGILQDTEYSYETITEPVDEIVSVGTKTTFGGVYIGEASKLGFLWPAPSCHYVSSPYGWRSSGWHNGIDLTRGGGGALGTPVIASKSGRVEVVQRSNSGYGNMVLINHGDGYKTRYAHMISGSITVSVGEYVEAGQTIGKVGSTGNSTGPHLHFEVIRNGETQNPKNYIS